MKLRLLPAGDTALVVELGDRIDRTLNRAVLALARRIEAAAVLGVQEIVPTFRSLLVYYEPLQLSYDALARRVQDLAQGLDAGECAAGRLLRLPVCYDENFAPDLPEIAARTGLTPAGIVERHSAPTYHVYMLGFLPGQAYMGDLPGDLAIPRRQSPRSRIPAGSVAVAMTMTCIFPQETPCGWHLIGRCPAPLFGRGPEFEPLLRPGDRVRFHPISLREFESWSQPAEAAA